MPSKDLNRKKAVALNAEYELMEAAMKRVYELSGSGKLIYKAALKVIPGSADTITTTTEAPNMIEKDKEEHSYITVSNDVESTPKDTYSDYESAGKDLDQDIKEDIEEDIEGDIEEKVRSLAIATARKLTPSKTKTTTPAEKDSVKRRLFTNSGRKTDNVSGVIGN